MKVKVYVNGRFIFRQLHDDFMGKYIHLNNYKVYVIPDKYSNHYVLEGYKTPYK